MTAIRYLLSKPGFATLLIYNYLSQKVHSLIKKHQEPGDFVVVWNSKNGSNQKVALGIFLYQLTSSNSTGERHYKGR